MLFWTKNSRSDTMRNDAIGVFDSGMGGLTAVKELNAILPHENIIYFGDTARIPYGSRSPETVLRYAKEDVAFLAAVCGENDYRRLRYSKFYCRRPALCDGYAVYRCRTSGIRDCLPGDTKRKNRRHRNARYHPQRQL